MADGPGELVPTASGVGSPCIGVCELDPRTNICRGCLRSASEIAAWRDASDTIRLAILERTRLRRKHIAPELDGGTATSS